MTDGRDFFAELKRRHVWRVATAYAIAAWLLVQIATQVFPFFEIPNWVVRLIVLMMVIGLPIALVLAWAFELTPEGIRRTAPVDSPDARPANEHRQVSRKLDVVIIAVLAIALALMGLRSLALWRPPATTQSAPTSSPDGAKRNPGMAAATTPDFAATTTASGQLEGDVASPLPASTAAIPEKSVAVLPFANESGKADQQFFSDGLSDDLINALSQFDGLKVISRNSAFQFRDSKDNADAIGRKLGVAHLLEGSVQRAENMVRITATLVNASDGSIVWSGRYDKPYRDLFALQDAITQAVADALKAKLLTAPGAVVQSDRPPGGNLEAYAAYQHGMAYAALGTEAGGRQAAAAFNEAIRLDPKYAAAYAQLSRIWSDLAKHFFKGDAEINAASVEARNASARALRLDSDSSLAHLAHADLLLFLDKDWHAAELEYGRALQLSPNDPEAKFGFALVLASLGQNRRAADLARQALVANPRNGSWYYAVGVQLAALGQLDAARSAITTAIALQPGAPRYHRQLAIVEILRGNATAAMSAAQQETETDWREEAVFLALQIGRDRAAADAGLESMIKEYAGIDPYQIAQIHALRREPDGMFQWLDRAWDSRDAGAGNLLSDPIILRFRDDPRFVAFCIKAGLPTMTDAVAME